MTVPYIRPRRLRDNAILRNAVAETHVGPEHLMLPVFVADTTSDVEVPTMPGVLQRSPVRTAEFIEQRVEQGLKSYILFGVPNHKDEAATSAIAQDGIIPRTLEAIKRRVGDAALIATDVCVCSYTTHGHCGVLAEGERFRVDNDPSIEILANMALAHAQAGADMVAPSDMMDGRVRHIREVLDEHAFEHIPIMSYAVKYASHLYGPFRHAADSSPKAGNRKGYQMDFRNRKSAMREAMLDIEEGADIIMVKPGIAYLDILRDLREICDVPLAAYQVSGEYAMLRYAAMADAIDEPSTVRELWHSFRRAGASIILSYHADRAIADGWL